MTNVAPFYVDLKNMSLANGASEGAVKVASREDLEAVKTKDLLAVYNNCSGKPAIKEFKTRTVGIDRVMAMGLALTNPAETVAKAAALPAEKKVTTGTKPAAKATEGKAQAKATTKAVAKTETKAEGGSMLGHLVNSTSKAVAKKNANPEPKKYVRTEVRAVDRIIEFGVNHETFTLAEIAKKLGLKETCVRTHMSFISGNPDKFGGRKFVGDRKTKTYRMETVHQKKK